MHAYEIMIVLTTSSRQSTNKFSRSIYVRILYISRKISKVFRRLTYIRSNSTVRHLMLTSCNLFLSFAVLLKVFIAAHMTNVLYVASWMLTWILDLLFITREYREKYDRNTSLISSGRHSLIDGVIMFHE